LTDNTLSKELFGILLGIVDKGTFAITTLTSEVHLFKFWEDSSSFCDYTSDLDEGI